MYLIFLKEREIAPWASTLEKIEVRLCVERGYVRKVILFNTNK